MNANDAQLYVINICESECAVYMALSKKSCVASHYLCKLDRIIFIWKGKESATLNLKDTEHINMYGTNCILNENGNTTEC